MALRHHEFAATRIAAPIDQVWALVCATDRYHEWIESTLDVVVAETPARLGSVFEERSRISGLFTATIRWTVTELEPGRRLAYAGTGVSVLADLGFSIDLEPLAGATETTLTLWYTMRLGPLGSFFELVTRSNVTNDQKRTVRTLAAIAERDDATDPPWPGP